MFRVDYKSKNFGYVGNDFFVDDKIKEQLPSIALALSKKLGEDVEFEIVGGY